MTHRLAAYGAQAAVVSGVLSIVGTVVLLFFFTLEAPAVVAGGNSDLWTPLGRANDLLVGLSGLAAIPLAALLRERWRIGKPAATATLIVGLVAMVGMGTFG